MVAERVGEALERLENQLPNSEAAGIRQVREGDAVDGPVLLAPEQSFEQQVRDTAYFMWEADGRPEGRGEHYWHLAHEEATRAMVAETATRTARATKGKNPSDIPPEVKAANKAAKSKVKVKVAEEATAKPAKKAKPAEAKAPKKEPKPRAAVQKAL
jgi:hypothetical protein